MADSRTSASVNGMAGRAKDAAESAGPEALMHGVLKLRKLVQADPDLGWRERYGALGTEEKPLDA